MFLCTQGVGDCVYQYAVTAISVWFARYLEARRYVDGMPTKGGFEQTDGSY